VSLFDDIYHFTHFTGFMLEEEIVASLWVLTRNFQNRDRWLILDTKKQFFLFEL
jgi:hypothetical protein